MLPPNSTPMRSRRLAYIIATYLLFTTWTCANAAEVSAAAPIAAISPTTPPAVQDVLVQLRRDDGDRDRDAGYAPNFDYFDRGVLGRQEPQPPQATELKNNEKKEVEIGPSATMHFMLKGQSGGHVWISANTCRQPVANGNETLKHSRQLVMFVSTSSQNKKPGPDSTDNLVTPQTGILFDEGFARLAVNTTSDVYIGIAAPNPEKDWTGSWSFEIAASADGPYHSYDASNPFLYMIDTDSESALFITYNLNEPNTTAARNWSESNPFSMYAFEAGERSDITGMEHSLCALKSLYGNSSLNTVTTITTKYGANVQKGQFHIQGLKNGTKYNGFLTVEGGKDTLRLQDGGTVRNGGMVFSQFEWITKADASCQVLFDLTFCDSVAYAVPSSPDFSGDDARLKKLYDEQAEKYYKNFTRSLAQVACDTESTAQYSLARTCKHCETDYKNWLCSVLIPRCEDWNAKGEWLQERNINALLPDGTMTYNGNISDAFKEEKRDRFAYKNSRNPMIDKDIRPGPYKEMKPCEDLCFDIVRSCPAQLGFSCPNSPAREMGYGKRDPKQEELRCNFPGAVVKLNVKGAAGKLTPRLVFAVVVTVLVAGFQLL